MPRSRSLIVTPGCEIIDEVEFDLIQLQHAETENALMIAFPGARHPDHSGSGLSRHPRVPGRTGFRYVAGCACALSISSLRKHSTRQNGAQADPNSTTG